MQSILQTLAPPVTPLGAEILDCALDGARQNFKLLAAVPELLEALAMLCPLTHLDTCAGLNFNGTEERENTCTCGATKARAAIAKAINKH